MLLSVATIATAGLATKALIRARVASLDVINIAALTGALESPARSHGQGIVTVSNHISTIDDPLMWAALPARYYLHERTTRWALGASDILFTNPLLSTFFRLGQTLETFRGQGVYQHALNAAIRKLDRGSWVHIFGEGRVNQSRHYQLTPLRLSRFKWGVGRILMETAVTPVVIPMWLTGFDMLMPEGRSFPFNYIPYPGARLRVAFGEPICPVRLRDVLGSYPKQPSAEHDKVHVEKIRAEVTEIVQQSVEILGCEMSCRS